MGIGMAVLQADAATAAHPGADPAVAGVKEHRQPRFRKDFVQRVGDAVVRERTAAAAGAVSGRGRPRPDDKPARLPDRVRRPASDRCWRTRSRCRRSAPRIRRPRRWTPAGRPVNPLVHGEHDAADLARPVVVGQHVPVASLRRSAPKYFCAATSAAVSLTGVLEVDVDVDGGQGGRRRSVSGPWSLGSGSLVRPDGPWSVAVVA